MNTELAIVDTQDAFTPKQAAALAQLGVKDASQADLAVYFHQCVRTGLDPFLKQIYMLGRKDKNSPSGTKQTIQTGIDGYRLIARRAADRGREGIAYEDTLWCGEDGKWVDIWLSPTPPAAAKVTVLRNGQRFPAVATWAEYAQTSTWQGETKPTPMWAKMPAGQLAKCAEALALRKAFPQDLSGIYTDAEMGQADAQVIDAAPSAQVASSVAPPVRQSSTKSGVAALRAATAPAPAVGEQPPPVADANDLVMQAIDSTSKDELRALWAAVENHPEAARIREAVTARVAELDEVVDAEIVEEPAA